MSAIERCRSAALGGHLLCCKDCAQIQIAYNSCRNRHCPKCQGSAARRWRQDRQADLLPVDYYQGPCFGSDQRNTLISLESEAKS